MSKAMFFRTNYRGRSPSARIIADALNQIGHALNNIVIDGNDAQVTPSGIVLTSVAGLAVAGSVFTGKYYFDHRPYTLIGDPQRFWYHDESANRGFWTPGPWQDPMPEMQYWRITAQSRPIEFIKC